MTYGKLPDWQDPTVPSDPTTRPTRTDYEQTARDQEERELAVAGAGEPLPFGYGPFRAGPLFAKKVVINSSIALLFVWCIGEVEAIDQILMASGDPVPAGVTFTHYTGSTTQLVDPTLAAYISGWTNNLVRNIGGQDIGLAYSVVIVPQHVIGGFPDFVADIRGLKVLDPRTGLTEYSENPSLALADYLSNPIYGRGKTLDTQGTIDCANANDEEIEAGEPRRTIGLLVDKPATMDQWAETLRGYAGCFIADVDGEIKLVPDRPVADEHIIALTDENIAADNNGQSRLKLSSESSKNIPTVVRIDYTDTTQAIHKTASAYAYSDGVQAGTTEWRESVVKMPGINRHSQADREAVERLNGFNLADLKGSVPTFDESIVIHKGDVISLTTSEGLSQKPFRVLDPQMTSSGRYNLAVSEYQPNVYSDRVEAAPIYTDTDMPDPRDIPAVVNLASSEEMFFHQDGSIRTRLIIDWDQTDYLYLDSYHVKIYEEISENLVVDIYTEDNQFVVESLEEGKNYIIAVAIASQIGLQGTWLLDTHFLVGKDADPADVPWLSGTVSASEVRLMWGEVADLDVTQYEIRADSDPAATWANAEFKLKSATAPPYTTPLKPKFGDITYMVKALDSVGLLSDTEARITLSPGIWGASREEVYRSHSGTWPGTLVDCSVDAESGDLVADWDGVSAYEDMYYYQHFGGTFGGGLEGWYRIALDIIASLGFEVRYYRWLSSGSYEEQFTWSAGTVWPGRMALGLGLWTYNGEQISIAIKVPGGASQGRISEMRELLLYPALVDTIQNQSISSSGTRISLNNADIEAIEKIDVSIQGGSTAIAAKVIDKDLALGPLVQCFDASGTAVAGVVDVTVIGY